PRLAAGAFRFATRPPRPGRRAVWAPDRWPPPLPGPTVPRRTRMPRTLQPLCDLVAGFGDRTAILALQRDDREEWSFAKLASHARRPAAGRREAGVRPGEPVALLAEDSPGWIVAALAILRAGAVVAPLDVQFTDEALAHVLRDSEARFLFTTARQLPRLRGLKHAPRRLLLLDAPAS